MWPGSNLLSMIKRKIHNFLYRWGTLMLAAVIPFSMRMTTWIIIMLTLNWLAEGDLKSKFKTGYKNPLLIGCTLYYLLDLYGLIFTHHFQAGFEYIQKEASFLAIPVIYFCNNSNDNNLRSQTALAFCLSVLATSLLFVFVGLVKYYQTGDVSFLFYHALVSPVNQHAVYFSIYTFICIAYLFNELKSQIPARYIFSIIVVLIYFSVLLFFLRSKSVVGITFIYAVYQLIISFFSRTPANKKQITYPAALMIGIIVVINTSNPFSREAEKLGRTNIKIVTQPDYNQGIYFNEVELRLVLWKFAFQLLHENNAWVSGVSPGDAQSEINRKIIDYHMYTGIPGTGDNGFLGYNLHNQYLETFYRSGIVGLLLLVWILFTGYRAAFRNRDEVLFFLLSAFAIVFITESVLEREFGIVPFIFFICLMAKTSTVVPLNLLFNKGYGEVAKNIR